MPRVAIITFPGTNCEDETKYAVERVTGFEAKIVFHEEFNPEGWDAVIIPGGFSYGDYGRAGLIASWSPVIEELKKSVEEGQPVLGICNGFQILTEAGLLPGTLLPNTSGRFIARWLKLKIHNPRGPWLALGNEAQTLYMPIAHAEGRYYHPSPEKLLADRPWIEYVENPNGSIMNIAGLASRDGLVLGLMPHPERAIEPSQTPYPFSPGGRLVFESLRFSLRRGW